MQTIRQRMRSVVTLEEHPRTGIVRVTFALPASIWADTIHLVGDINNWSSSATPLQLDDMFWSVSLALEAGRTYRYRYLVDSREWLNDWHIDRDVLSYYGDGISVLTTPVYETKILAGQDVRHGETENQEALVTARAAQLVGTGGWRTGLLRLCPFAGMMIQVQFHHHFCARSCQHCPFRVASNGIEPLLDREAVT